MEEPISEKLEYVVEPTGLPKAEGQRFSDIAMTGLFNAHIAIRNSERQAIWSRYNVMLAANAAFFGFLSTRQNLSTVEVLVGFCFGMALCTLWWMQSKSGWKLMEMRRSLTFPLCCFDHISCWLPRNTP